MQISFLGELVELNEARSNFVPIYKMFNERSNSIEDAFYEEYGKYQSLDSMLLGINEAAQNYVTDAIEHAIRYIQEKGVYELDAEDFLEKYVRPLGVMDSWDEAYEEVFGKYALIEGNTQQGRELRELRKESRSRWVGGGFGLEGAIKGSMQAGMLNAASGLMHGIANSVGNWMDEMRANEEKREILNNPNTSFGLFEGLKETIQNLAYATGICLKEYAGIPVEWASEDEKKRAKTILDNIHKKVVPEDKRVEQILRAWKLDPFSAYVYLTIFNCHLHKTENAEKVTELFGYDPEDVRVATLHGFMKSLDASQLDKDTVLLAKDALKTECLALGYDMDHIEDGCPFAYKWFQVLDKRQLECDEKPILDLIYGVNAESLSETSAEKLFEDVKEACEKQGFDYNKIEQEHPNIYQYIVKIEERLETIDSNYKTVDGVKFETREEAKAYKADLEKYQRITDYRDIISAEGYQEAREDIELTEFQSEAFSSSVMDRLDRDRDRRDWSKRIEELKTMLQGNRYGGGNDRVFIRDIDADFSDKVSKASENFKKGFPLTEGEIPYLILDIGRKGFFNKGLLITNYFLYLYESGLTGLKEWKKYKFEDIDEITVSNIQVRVSKPSFSVDVNAGEEEKLDIYEQVVRKTFEIVRDLLRNSEDVAVQKGEEEKAKERERLTISYEEDELSAMWKKCWDATKEVSNVNFYREEVFLTDPDKILEFINELQTKLDGRLSECPFLVYVNLYRGAMANESLNKCGFCVTTDGIYKFDDAQINPNKNYVWIPITDVKAIERIGKLDDKISINSGGKYVESSWSLPTGIRYAFLADFLDATLPVFNAFLQEKNREALAKYEAEDKIKREACQREILDGFGDYKTADEKTLMALRARLMASEADAEDKRELLQEIRSLIQALRDAPLIKELEEKMANYAELDEEGLLSLGEKIRKEYPERLTRDYTAKIDALYKQKKEQRIEAELKAICSDLSAMAKPELLELKKRMEAEYGNYGFTKNYLNVVQAEINQREAEQLRECLAGYENMGREQLRALKQRFVALDCSAEVKAMFQEQFSDLESRLAAFDVQYALERLGAPDGMDYKQLVQAMNDLEKMELERPALEKLRQTYLSASDRIMAPELNALGKEVHRVCALNLYDVNGIQMAGDPKYEDACKLVKSRLKSRLAPYEKEMFICVATGLIGGMSYILVTNWSIYFERKEFGNNQEVSLSLSDVKDFSAEKKLMVTNLFCNLTDGKTIQINYKLQGKQGLFFDKLLANVVKAIKDSPIWGSGEKKIVAYDRKLSADNEVRDAESQAPRVSEPGPNLKKQTDGLEHQSDQPEESGPEAKAEEANESNAPLEVTGLGDKIVELFKPYENKSGFGVTPKLIAGLELPRDAKVCVGYDDTIFRTGKIGFAITEEGIYYRGTMDKKASFIPMTCVKNAKSMAWVDARLIMDGKVIMLCTMAAWREDLLRIMQELVAFLNARA